MKINYTESTETLRNPEMGYPCFSRWQDLTKDGINPDSHGNYPTLQGFTNQLYTLSAFTKVGGGEDIPITDAALKALGDQLSQLEEAGGSAILRFSYDSRGVKDCEPESLDMILHHIAQIGAVLREHHNAVAGMEAGIFGLWGEMHTSKYCASEYSKPIIDALLDACPDGKPVLVRNPFYLMHYTGLKNSELAKYTPEPGSKAERLGIYNDGYMGSDNDLGTWMDDSLTRHEGVQYLNRVGGHSFYGGEYSSADWWTARFHTWLPQYAIPEMYMTHTDYIRGNVFHNKTVSYEDFIYSADYEYSWFPDNSAYYGQNCHKFIRDHIGYRYVIRESNISTNKREVTLSGIVENTGFSATVNKKQAAIIFVDENENCYRVPVDLDVRQWLSCQKTPYSITALLPSEAPSGNYRAHLRVSLPANDEEHEIKSSIKFANIDIYDENAHANYLGEFVL